MRAAMVGAAVGDDVYAEDPTVSALEDRVAGLLGHEAGLFFPTGSMANMVGLCLLAPAGTEVLADVQAHVLRAELGGHGALGGLTMRTWSDGGPSRLLDADVPLALMTPDPGPYLVRTAAVAVENTHNFGGGTVQPFPALERLRAGTAAVGVAIHLDGARLWNAHVATGVPLHAYGGCADTVSVCLSKGLGAPVGSVLASSRDRIGEARILRKRYGGGMRQVGLLAAAGLYALDHHVARLAEDHRRARDLARACAEARPGCVDPERVQTNIVILDTGDLPAARVAAEAAAGDVRVSAFGGSTLRLVTHLDLDDDATARAAAVLASALRG
jgi:threonine aldolase